MIKHNNDKAKYIRFEKVLESMINGAKSGYNKVNGDSRIIVDGYLFHNKYAKIIKRAFKNGYYLVKDIDENVNLHIAKHHPLRFHDMKIIILDGTANIDPYYKLFKYEIKQFNINAQIGTIYLHCLKNQKYKTSLIKTEISTIKNIIYRIREQQPEKNILVITSNKYEQQIQLLNIPFIKLDHFQNLKGRNDLLQYEVIYFTHIFQKNIETYKFMLVSSAGKISEARFQRKKFDKYSWGFSEQPILESIRVHDIIACLIQDIYRTGIRECRDVHVYLGITDLLILNWLIRYFENIKLIRENY